MELAEKDLAKHWDEYMAECVREGLRGSLSDYMIWLEENHPEMFSEFGEAL